MRNMLAPVLGLLFAGAPAGAQITGLSGTLVVTNKSPHTATLIDVASGNTLATLPTGQGPHEVVISSDGRTAVVTDYGGGNSLTVIDVPGRRVARTIPLGQYTRPHGIAFLPGDSLVAVTSEATQNVVVVNVVVGAIRKAVPTQHPGSHMVGVVANGSLAYTGDMSSNTVSELNLQTGQYVRSWNVPETPEAINVTPDGTEVWVGSNETGRVSVVKPADGSVTTAAEGLSWPYRVLFTPDATKVLIPDYRGNAVRILERSSRNELARLDLAGAGPQGITISPDGRYVFLSLSREARVAIIDMNTHTVVGHLPAGQTPDGVAYTTMTVGSD